MIPKVEQAAGLSAAWWSSLEARTRFEQVWELGLGCCVVCLGRKVATAAGIGHVPWGEWAYRSHAFGLSRPIVSIPHPSGLNRLYNVDENRALAARVLREAIDLGRM